VIPPVELLERWGQELEVLRACGAAEAAATREQDIRELRAWWSEFQLEELTLEQAAVESGLAYDTIQRKVATGVLPNAGAKNRPRVRRGDLPMAPTRNRVNPGGSDLASRINGGNRA
jgi:hypothetical protein